MTIVVTVTHINLWYAPHVVASKVLRVRTSHRLGVRVGHARLTVPVNLLAERTVATRPEQRCPPLFERHCKTQLLATTVAGSHRARVFAVDQLFVFAVNLHAHQPVSRLPDLDVVQDAGQLVQFNYSVSVPIDDVHPI